MHNIRELPALFAGFPHLLRDTALREVALPIKADQEYSLSLPCECDAKIIGRCCLPYSTLVITYVEDL